MEKKSIFPKENKGSSLIQLLQKYNRIFVISLFAVSLNFSHRKHICHAYFRFSKD